MEGKKLQMIYVGNILNIENCGCNSSDSQLLGEKCHSKQIMDRFSSPEVFPSSRAIPNW